eukprot:Nitzschia sp. Nitz4//scaffold15_size197535//127748//130735//NITZ4_001591-RA/size197535-processed-gene-0.82-mRNA-1//-1//CDS//3329537754//3207//frame0
MDYEDDPSLEAYESIAKQLREFTSPKLGKQSASMSNRSFGASSEDTMMWEASPRATSHSNTPTGTSYYYGEDDMDNLKWMERELEPVQTPAPKTPRRTPLLERADTPVMSNSSSHKHLDESTPATSKAAAYGTPPSTMHQPYPVNTPMTVQTTTKTPAKVSLPPSNTLSPLLYCRYHDTLWTFLKAKRSLSHRLELERMDQDPASHDTSLLAPQEMRVELDYLSQLQQLCGGSTLEGDCWLLLARLRPLGFSAMLWDESVAPASVVQPFLYQLSQRVQDTPEQLLQHLTSQQAPLLLQRRHVILQWIQACLDQRRPAPPTRPLSKASTSHPDDDDVSAPALWSESSSTQEQTFLRASLGYILAGRVQDAQQLARTQGQPWRAAAWGGGQPSGLQTRPHPTQPTLEVESTGNPARFLWKRRVWKQSRRWSAAMLDPTTKNQAPELEAAISSVLSNDLQTSLGNVHLRTWSQAMGVAWLALWNRTQDELLHQHNQQRRRHQQDNNLGGPMDGTQYLSQEEEHLQSTFQLSNLTDTQLLGFLTSSPFMELRGTGPYEQAMMAFCIGATQVARFCETVAESLHKADLSDTTLGQLRFVTHLLLFLESLQVSTTPIVVNGVSEHKNRVLFQYIQGLETRPELWNLVALYVSLLSQEQMLEWYPSMLSKVTVESERKSMLHQMQELFPHLVLPVLRKTVRWTLGSTKASDELKFHAIQWLLYQEAHAGDALICANILLRDFFDNNEDDKLETAMTFLENHLPDELEERASQSIANTGDALAKQVQDAGTEYLSFSAYLEAYRTFGKWKDILTQTPTVIRDTIAGVDINRLQPTEQEIYHQRSVREWTKIKEKNFQLVLEAAEQARTELHDVLTYPGGWLSLDELPKGASQEEKTRQEQIQSIRSRYLVVAVGLYMQVCESTASWLSRSLDDTSWLSREENLEMFKSYKPDVWYQRALDVATLVADDRYGIHQAIDPDDLKEILAKLAEVAISKLMAATPHY